MIVAIAIAVGCVEGAAQPPPPAAGPTAQETPATPVPAAVLLAPGQIQTVDVAQVTRVAIGDPAIADVTIISPAQILVQAKRTGSTNLILWDAAGQHQTTISVIDPASETIGKEITALVQQLAFPSVEVKLQSGKVFLLGEVASDAELGVLEQMATSFKDVVVNLVKVREPAAPPEGPAPLVKLSVQVLEINHTATEKLGVNWSSSMSLTDPSTTDLTGTTALTRFGTSLTRSSLAWTINALVQDNKARLLTEPTLVTASGKEASSFIGVEVPVIQATSIGTEAQSVNASIEFRETGVLLKITPTVIDTAEGQKITTVLLSEVSDLDKSVGLTVPVGTQTILVPGFKTRKTSTEVTTVSGETIVIAGLLELEDSHTMSQVPAFGSLPILGRLFRTPEISDTRNELVITVTPELLADQANQAERGLALEQALAVAEVTASVQDPRLRYALQIQDRIAKQLRYPQREKELGLDGTVKLRLHLFRDGTLGRAVVSSSSGIEALDMEALKVAESQAPYPSFPSQLAEQELWLEVPVIFRP